MDVPQKNVQETFLSKVDVSNNELSKTTTANSYHRDDGDDNNIITITIEPGRPDCTEWEFKIIHPTRNALTMFSVVRT